MPMKNPFRDLSKQAKAPTSLSFVGRTSWSAADVLVGLLNCVANRASRTGTSGAGQETRPTILSSETMALGESARSTMGSTDRNTKPGQAFSLSSSFCLSLSLRRKAVMQ